MAIIIRVVEDRQISDNLDTRKNDLENQCDTLKGEMGVLDSIKDDLADYDIEDTKEELEDANVSDSSLSEKLDRLDSVKSEFIRNLLVVRGDLEARLQNCLNRLGKLLSESESESIEEDASQDTMWRL